MKNKLRTLASLPALFIGWTTTVARAQTSIDVPSYTLGTGDLKETIGHIVEIVLSFLGILTVLIILLGGFKWMTSGGNEEKISEAKKLISAGIVGLAIVLAAYIIAGFVVKSLITATS